MHIIPIMQSLDGQKRFAYVSNDYSRLTPLNSGVQALYRSYANLTLAVATDYFLDTVSFPQNDSVFDACRSLVFSFRPLYNGADFNTTAPANLFDTCGAIVVFNTRTYQRVTIEPERLPLTYVVNGANNKVLSPFIAHIEGAAPFFATINDTIELAFIGCTQGWGKIDINFANFDIVPWRASMFSNNVLENT